MSLRTTLAVLALLTAGLVLPATAPAMALRPVPDEEWAGRLAPGPGSSVWTLGDDALTLTDRTGTVLHRWSVDAHGTSSRLAAGPDGSAWIDVAGKPALDRVSPDGERRRFVLPVNPWARDVDDLDVAPSGVAWATATVRTGRSAAKRTYAMRIDPDGSVLMSKSVPTTNEAAEDGVRPPAIAAVSGGEAWMGTRCGRIRVRVRGNALTLGPRPRTSCGRDDPDTPLALRLDPSGALWEVLAGGVVRRTVAGRSRTLGHLGAARHRVGLAFTGHGRAIRAWLQTGHRVIEITAAGRTTTHALPRRLLPGDVETIAQGIATDRADRLWLVADRRLQRVRTDRCPVRRVVGLRVADAVQALRASGCHVRLGAAHGPGDGTVRVRAQSIPAGTVVPAGTTVLLDRARDPARCAIRPQREQLVLRSPRWTITASDRSGYNRTSVCDRRTGRRWVAIDGEVDDEFGDSSYAGYRLHGDWLGFVRHYESGISHEGGDESTSLEVIDVRHHRRTKVTEFGSSWWADASSGEGGGGPSGTAFTSWALDDRGDVAWLEPHAVRLLRRGARRSRVLDAAETAVYGALSIDGRRVRWTRDGTSGSALI